MERRAWTLANVRFYLGSKPARTLHSRPWPQLLLPASPGSTGCAVWPASSCSRRTVTTHGWAAMPAKRVFSRDRNCWARCLRLSFLFLAGISFALVTDKLIRKGLTPAAITRTMARRGAEILAFGLLFRLQEFLIAWGWAPWSDLLRVDVLNIIGLSMILMALLCGVTLTVWRKTSDSGQEMSQSVSRWRAALVIASIVVAALIALLTPPLHTTWRPNWLPWPLESYINGCHNLGVPQGWLFPLFPWAAFAFAGLAAGFIVFSDRARNQTAKTLALFAAVGAASHSRSATDLTTLPSISTPFITTGTRARTS